MKRLTALLLVLALLCTAGCAPESASSPAVFSLGHAAEQLELDLADGYFLAGYHNGEPPQTIRDLPTLQAVWLDDGTRGVFLIVVDCIALDGGSVSAIRAAMADLADETDCAAIHVVSTHTHAGVDTLGLWGEIARNGKNEAFMASLPGIALRTARAAYADRTPGTLGYSRTQTENLQRDSRDPQVYDPDLYQLRFVPADGRRGVRIVSYAAHAEALRGGNRAVSRDFPGLLRDIIHAETGDELLFLPGAIGGLIMTRELIEGDAEANLIATAEALAAALLAPRDERSLAPRLQTVRLEFSTPLDNTLFLYYKFLGILGQDISRGLLGGYRVSSELNLLALGDLTLALLPGEVFPELIVGEGLDPTLDPTPLAALAADAGLGEVVYVGLANDELGYILPPSAYLLDDTLPYINGPKGHYEETNSVGRACAHDLAAAFARAAEQINFLD